jgi:membrane associated rhomboid family serine protease
MIPVQDVIPTRTRPAVTMALIAVNAFTLIAQRLIGANTESLTVVSPLLSIFSHRTIVQFIANMLLLWLFGATVEDQLGRVRFAVLYVLCGVIATFAHLTMDDGAFTSLASASSALAGVLGAYFLMYPRSRVLTFVPWPLGVHEIPAGLFLAAWAAIQLVTIAASTPIIQFAGTALASVVMTHVGAFGAGALLCLAFRRPERARVDWWHP